MIIGWLSPEGRFYECGTECHVSRATEICRTLKSIETSNGERYLEEAGWVKLTYDEIFFPVTLTQKKLRGTSKQYKWLFEHEHELSSKQKLGFFRGLKYGW